MANIYKMDEDYVSAESVYDRTQGKKQDTINTELFSKVGPVNNLSTFQNNWTVNGGCFYQRIGDLGIINCSIRNGTVSEGIQILAMGGMKPATNSLAVCFNAASSTPNGYVLIETSGAVTLHNVTTNTSVVFTLLYRCA